MFLKISKKCTGKDLCRSLFFINVDFIKKDTPIMCLPVNFTKFLRTPFLQNSSSGFFSTQPHCCLVFQKLSLKCYLSVPYYIKTFSYRDALSVLYLSLCLRLGLFLIYVFFFPLPFFFSLKIHCDRQSCFFGTFLSKVQSLGVVQLLLNFLPFLAWCCF